MASADRLPSPPRPGDPRRRPHLVPPGPAAGTTTSLDGGDGGAGEATPAWPWVTGVVLSVAGFVVSAYLTYAHYTSPSALACPDTGLVNCAKVTTSPYSHILGVPVAVLGLVFFAAMFPLQLRPAWRSRLVLVRWGRLAGTVVGVGMVLWLLYAELFLIDNICLYCSAVHVLTVLLFFSTALGTASTAPLPAE